MMWRKLIMMAISALVAHFGLTQAGYVGDAPASIPGLGTTINAQAINWILTIAAAFLPQLADKYVPGLGAWLSKIFDALLKPAPATDGTSTDLAVVPNVNRSALEDDVSRIKALSERLPDDAEAQKLLRQIAAILVDHHLAGKGTKLVTQEQS